MEIPIMLAASPITVHFPGTWIPIRFDRWSVRVEGLVDSHLTLCFNGSGIGVSIPNGQVFNRPNQVRVEFFKRGTEKAITVFAVEHK